MKDNKKIVPIIMLAILAAAFVAVTAYSLGVFDGERSAKIETMTREKLPEPTADEVNTKSAVSTVSPETTDMAFPDDDMPAEKLIVYRTKTGDCYHMEYCIYLKSSIEISLADAKNRGLRPCTWCCPPY